MTFDNKLLQILDELGEDNSADFDDYREGYFGWRLFYQNGDLCLRVTFEDFNELDPDPTIAGQAVTEQTWILTPQS